MTYLHNKFRVCSSTVSFLNAIKSKTTENFRTDVTFHYIKIALIKAAHFPTIYYHTSLHDPETRCASFAPTS
jgi:hypothetical protein